MGTVRVTLNKKLHNMKFAFVFRQWDVDNKAVNVVIRQLGNDFVVFYRHKCNIESVISRTC